MPDALILSLEIQLLTYSYHADRDHFSYETETYAEWAWLALEEGRFWYRLGRGKTALEGECSAGDWILCPPGEPLQRRLLNRSKYHFSRFVPTFSGAEIQDFAPLRGPATLRDTARLRLDFSALRNAGINAQTNQWRAHLLLDLLRAAEWERGNSTPPRDSDPVMEKARLFLETHLEQKISMADLARQARLTPATFSRRFRAATGAAPQEYLLVKRLDLARQLLLDTGLSIEAIAARCGFANGFYLSRLWAKRFGSAPSHFRRLHRV